MNYTKEELDELMSEANHVDQYRSAGGKAQVSLDPETVQDLVRDIFTITAKVSEIEELNKAYQDTLKCNVDFIDTLTAKVKRYEDELSGVTGKLRRYEECLLSISKNSCCEQCQEAKFAAIAALNQST